MNFSDILNQYIEQYELTSSDISVVTGISKSTISRFRNGIREPLPDSDVLKKLAMGISILSQRKKSHCSSEISSPVSTETILEIMKKSLKTTSVNLDLVITHLNLLINMLNINANDLSHYLKYDASYLSRIRSRQRRPSNVSAFCNGISEYVIKKYASDYKTELAILVGCEESIFCDAESSTKVLLKWLTDGNIQQDNAIQHFLHSLDEFDLNEYIAAIHFNTLRIPSVPFQLPTSKNYYKLNGFMEAELNWLKATVLSHSTDSVLFYSDMPMEEMAKDDEFPKKWMYGIALLLKKGLHLNVIHNIDRPLYEMMLGLESWIPLYMTGQVSPYYLKGMQDPFFHHFLRVSGAAVLSGEAIAGYHSNGQYHLSKTKDEISYYQMRGQNLLSKASPLMEIYTVENSHAFLGFIKAINQMEYSNEHQAFHNILSSPPIYTLSVELLKKILYHNNISMQNSDTIISYAQKSRTFINALPQNCIITDELPNLTKEEFDVYPVFLPLSDLFLGIEIKYSYEEYLEHIRMTKSFVCKSANYNCNLLSGQPYRNIQIRIVNGKNVIISKNKSPEIHFVIKHPKLRQAFENMITPITEK